MEELVESSKPKPPGFKTLAGLELKLYVENFYLKNAKKSYKVDENLYLFQPSSFQEKLTLVSSSFEEKPTLILQITPPKVTHLLGTPTKQLLFKKDTFKLQK